MAWIRNISASEKRLFIRLNRKLTGFSSLNIFLFPHFRLLSQHTAENEMILNILSSKSENYMHRSGYHSLKRFPGGTMSIFKSLEEQLFKVNLLKLNTFLSH